MKYAKSEMLSIDSNKFNKIIKDKFPMITKDRLSIMLGFSHGYLSSCTSMGKMSVVAVDKVKDLLSIEPDAYVVKASNVTPLESLCNESAESPDNTGMENTTADLSVVMEALNNMNSTLGNIESALVNILNLLK